MNTTTASTILVVILPITALLPLVRPKVQVASQMARRRASGERSLPIDLMDLAMPARRG